MKKLSIPFAKVLKEFNKNFRAGGNFCSFICNLSPTFKKLWENYETKEIIRDLAAEFLKENNIKDIEVSEMSTILFYYSHAAGLLGYKELNLLKDKTRKDFIIWGAAKNKRKKRLQTS